MPARPASSWKTMCAKTIHATSISRGPSVAISQSSTATGSKSSYSTLPTRESPQTSTGSVAATSSGQFASSQSSARSTSGDRPMSGTANSYQDLQPVEVAPQRGSASASVDVGQEPEGRLGVGDRVQLGEHLDGAVLQFALRSAGGVGEPVVAERVGHHVGRHDARRRGPSGRTACRAPRRSAPATAPAAPGRRSSRRPAGSRRTGGPSDTTRTPARPASVGATRATHFSSRRCPSSSQRPVRMIVSDDMPLASTPLSTVICGCDAAGHHGGQPLRHHVGQRADVSTRMHWSRPTSSTAGSVAMRILPSGR